ncbi:MAG: hypothetical protein Q9192_003916 [Flavoplaca navasiana]
MTTSVQKNLVKRNERSTPSVSPSTSSIVKKEQEFEGLKSMSIDEWTNPVTCMDARIDPATAFGINLGDAHVIRNAGGNAQDSLRSLVISEQLLGTNEILLIKHTGCGMMTFKNEDIHAVVDTQLGAEAKAELAGMDFQPFPCLEDGVRDDVEFLKRSKAIPDSVAISGWVYEIESGKVRQVV